MSPHRDFDVVVIGAGAAGLYALHRLRGLGLSVRVFRAGRRRRGDVVLESLSRGPLRRGELGLLLFVLRGARAGVGLERAVPHPGRTGAVLQPRRRSFRPASRHRARHPCRAGPLRRGPEPVGHPHLWGRDGLRPVPGVRGWLSLRGQQAEDRGRRHVRGRAAPHCPLAARGESRSPTSASV